MKRILVVDDDPDIRHTVQLVLQRADYQVDTAEVKRDKEAHLP